MAERRDQSCPRVQGAILQTRCLDNNHPTLSLTLSLALTLPAIRSCSYRCLATSKTAVATTALPLMNRVHSHHTSIISYLSGWLRSWNTSSQPLWKHPQLGYVLLTINMLQAGKEGNTQNRGVTHLSALSLTLDTTQFPTRPIRLAACRWQVRHGPLDQMHISYHWTWSEPVLVVEYPLHHTRLDCN